MTNPEPDPLDKVDEASDQIDQSIAKLRKALEQAGGNEVLKKEIQKQIDDLILVQGRLDLDALAGVAKALNALSDALDKAIETIKHHVDNFLIDDLKKIKSKVAEIQSGSASG